MWNIGSVKEDGHRGKRRKLKKGGGVIECLCPPQIHVEVLNPSVMILGGEAFWDMIRS